MTPIRSTLILLLLYLMTIELNIINLIQSAETSESVDSNVSNSVNNEVQVQKCCPENQVIVVGVPGSKSTCEKYEQEFNLDVYTTNGTHYWNYTKTSQDNVNVVVNNPCNRRYFLDPANETDRFVLLDNTSLYLPFNSEMLSQSDYCMDIVKTSTAVFVTAIMCITEESAFTFHYLFGAGQLISTVCLIGLAYYSWKRDDIDQDHKKCLAYFAGAMAVTFFIMTVSTFFGQFFNFTINTILGISAFIVYYLILTYYAWLSVLCYDTFRCIRHSQITPSSDGNNKPKSQMERYLMAAFISPVIFVVISFFDGCKPALPNLYTDYIYSSNKYWCVFLFFVPTGLLVLINVAALTQMSLPPSCTSLQDLIAQLSSPNWVQPYRNLPDLKKLYKSSAALFILMLIIWLFDFIIFLLPSSNELQPHFLIRDVFACLQGLFISVIFVRKDWIHYLKRGGNNYANNGIPGQQRGNENHSLI